MSFVNLTSKGPCALSPVIMIMNNFLKFNKFLFLFVCFQVQVLAMDTTYWTLTDSQEDYRHFLQIIKENEQFKVIELEQDKGDFPYILATHAFSEQSSLNTFLSSFKPQTDTVSKDLVDWVASTQAGLHTNETSSSLRKLFGIGKNNKNIWEATQQWSDEWEDKFSAWISENVNEEFFVQYGISTDCADAVLGMRWIFSRIHGLPVANHISISSQLFTNLSMPKDWRKISKAQVWHEDRLFMTALNYVMKLASTRTMLLDSYPVALTKKGLQVGSFVLTESEDSNHVKIISENNFSDPTDLPLFTLASTVPRKVRLLVREVITDQGWPVAGEKSFLKFRRPIVSNGSVYLQSKQSHADYSLEQFDSALREEEPIFIKFLLGRLKESYDPQNLVELALVDILEYTQQRIEVVQEGAEFCQRNDCSAGTANWDAWSTPSRDKKLKDKFSNIDLLTSQFEDFAPGLVEKWMKAQSETKVSILEYSLSLKTIRYLLENGYASSEPSDTVEKRWGIDLEDTASNLIASIVELLEQRKEIIESQWEVCSPNDCFAKTAKWLSWNTFKVDEELLNKYDSLNNLCNIYGSSVCFDLIFDQSLLFDSETEVLSIREWVERIPFFYSNLDASKERKWGVLPEYNRTITINYSESVVFSQNERVLIDSKRLVDLSSGQSLINSKGTETLYLSLRGDILTHDTLSEKLKINHNLGHSVELEKVNFTEEMSKVIKNFSSSSKYTVIGFNSRDSNSLYSVVFDNKGKLLFGPSLSVYSDYRNKESFFFPREQRIISLYEDRVIDLSEVINHLKIDDKLVKLENLSFMDWIEEENQFFFVYYNDDLGINYPILIKNAQVRALDLGSGKNVLVKDFNLKEGAFFLDHLVSEEYPKSLLLTLSRDDQVVHELGNSFSQILKTGNTYYFSVLKGSAWDSNRLANFYKYSEGSLKRFTAPFDASKYSLSHFTINGYFLNNDSVYDRGLYEPFNEDMSSSEIATPSYIRANNDLCRNTMMSNASYIEQFSYQHGDYNCYASVYESESKQESLYTLAFRTDKSYTDKIKNSFSQRLQIISDNTIIWWAKNTK